MIPAHAVPWPKMSTGWSSVLNRYCVLVRRSKTSTEPCAADAAGDGRVIVFDSAVDHGHFHTSAGAAAPGPVLGDLADRTDGIDLLQDLR